MKIYKKCTNPEVFGFGILLPKKIYSYILDYKKELLPFIDWFIEKDYSYPGSNSMVAHISLKYLGYHKNYSNKDIEKLIPDLKKISRKYLPLKIKIKGLKVEYNPDYKSVNVFLNFYPKKEVIKFHNEIIKKLDVDIFENFDGKSYNPHIVIANSSKDRLKEIKKIEKSRNDKEIEINCKDLYIFFKGKGPVKI